MLNLYSVNHKNSKNAITSLLLITLMITPLIGLITIQPASAQPTTVLTPKWTRSGLGTNWEGGLVIGDVTGDGDEDVVYAGTLSGASNDRVYVLDGDTGATIATYTNERISQYGQPQLYDVDGDGVLDILVPLYFEPGLAAVKYRGDSTLQQLWVANIQRVDGEPTPSGSVMAKPIAGDINGDLDIFIASQDVSPLGVYDGTIVRLDHNGNEIARNTAWRACSGGLSLADTDGDGVFEIYQGDRQMGYSDGGYGKGTKSYWAENLTERWVRLDFLSSSQAPVLADVNGDGILDVLAGMYRETNVLNSANGAWISRATGMSVHYGITVYDIDGDGNLEILSNDGDHDDDAYTDVYDLVTGAQDAQLPLAGGDSKWSPLVADIDPTHPGMEIISVPNGTSLSPGYWRGAIMIFSSSYESIQNITRAPSSTPGVYSNSYLGSQLAYPIVQDIDGDNRLELVTHASSGTIYAFDTSAPVPAQRIRSEVTFFGEKRTGAAVYEPEPWSTNYWTAPLVAAIWPDDNALAVPISSNQLSFKLRDHQNDSLTYSVTTSPDIGSRNGLISSGDTYDWNVITVDVSGLAYDTTYTWTVTANDGSEVTSRTYTFRTEQAPNPGNIPPTQGNPTLVSLDGQGTTTSTFQASNQSTTDVNGDTVTNIYRWKVNGDPVAQLLLPFDTRDETSTADYSSFDNNGVVKGATWVPKGKVGGAYSFDGKDDGIIISDGGLGYFNNRTYPAYPNHEELGGFGTWNGVTVEAWVYLTEYNNGSRIVGKIPSYALGFQSGSTNRIYGSVWPMGYQIADDDNQASTDRERSVSANVDIQLNTWYHIAFSYQSGVGLKLYFNGALVAQSSAYVGPVKESFGEPVTIGRLVQPFAGMIDEVRLYSYAVPAEQIYNRYTESKDGDSSSSLFNLKGFAAPGDTLICDVVPIDSYAEGSARSVSTVLLSSKPIASNLNISPIRDRPYRLDNENLIASYDYSEADGTPESGTQIRWYRNGVLQSSFNNVLEIPASSTAIGQTWYFTVEPRDSGGDIGTLQTSETITIRGNSAPSTGIPTLDSMDGGTDYDDEDLVATAATTTDGDSDSTTNIYHWTKNGLSLTNLQMPFDIEVPLIPGTNGITQDYSGYGNNGQVNGATWVQDGVIGGALSFNGSEYVTVQENSNTLGGSGSWSATSVEFWIKATGATTSTQTVVLKPDASYSPTASSYGIGYKVQYRYAADSYRVYWIVGNNSAQISLNQRVYEGPDQWHHVVCTYQSGVGLKIYTDGQLRGSPLAATGNINATVGGLLYLGGINSGLGDFNGTLDEVRIYPNALSAAQVFQRYIDTRDGVSDSETIVPQETANGNNWVCQVIPNDSWGDGTAVNSQTLHVNAVIGNSRPRIDWYSPANTTSGVAFGSTINFAQVSSDPDSNTLSYSWTLDSVQQDTTQNWTYPTASAGTHHVRVTVSDGSLSDYQEWVVNVDSNPLSYDLTMLSSTNGNTIPAAGVTQYLEGSPVSIQAIPNEGYTFSYWLQNNTNAGAANPYQLTMDNNYNLSAVFVPQVFTLAVNVVGDGSVVKSPDQATYQYGTNVTLTATENSGMTFDGWTGDASGTAHEITVNVNSNKVITANFSPLAIFKDGFESASFTQWNSTTRTTGETTSVLSNTVHSGSYSAMVTSSGGGGYERAYATRSGLSLSELYTRAYVYVGQSGMVDNGDRFYFMQLMSGGNALAYAGWRLDASGNLLWHLMIRDGTNTVGAYSTAVPATGTWYCVELHWKADSTVGLGELYVNGQLVASIVNRNTANYGSATIARIGLPEIYNCASTTAYIDDVAIATSYLGPVQEPIPEHAFLTIGSAIGGSTNPSAGIYQLDKNSIQSISATPNSGYTLSGWLLNGVPVANTNPYMLTMNADYTLTPVFAVIPPPTYYQLTVSTSGSGTTNATGTNQYVEGSNIAITATAGSNWKLDHWLLNGTNVGSANPYVQTMDANYDLTAVFTENPPQHQLHVQTSGSGLTNATGDSSYDYGTSVSVLATSAVGWEFSYWLLDNVNAGTANPFTVNMIADYNLTAVFVPQEYTLTVNVVGDGSVVRSPDQATYQYGTNVTLTATENSGSVFDGWTGDAIGIGPVITINMTSNKVITATFNVIPDNIVFADGFESGTFSAWTTSSVTSGETVAITTNPVYYGNYAANFTSNGNGGYEKAYVTKSLNPALSTIDVQASFQLSQNGIVENGDRIKLIELRSGTTIIASAGVIERSNTLRWWLETKDGTTYVETYAQASTDLSNWFTIELQWLNSASIGGGSLWVNGTPVIQVSNDNTSNYGSCTEARIGLTEVYNCGATALSVDNAKIATEYIGP